MSKKEKLLVKLSNGELLWCVYCYKFINIKKEPVVKLNVIDGVCLCMNCRDAYNINYYGLNLVYV